VLSRRFISFGDFTDDNEVFGSRLSFLAASFVGVGATRDLFEVFVLRGNNLNAKESLSSAMELSHDKKPLTLLPFLT